MRRARALDDSDTPVAGRGAERSALRPTPLTLVAGAVAGDDLQSVVTSVAQALQCAVAIAIPALGDPVIHPAAALDGEATAAIAGHAAAIGRGEHPAVPEVIVEAVPVRIGEQIVGIVAAAGAVGAVGAVGDPAIGGDGDRRESGGERRAWLEAAAAAASVTTLIREAVGGSPEAGEALVAELAAGAPDDLAAFVARARRLGVELGMGAVAISARRLSANGADPEGDDGLGAARDPAGAWIAELRDRAGALIAELTAGRFVAVVPLAGGEGFATADEVAAELRERGLAVTASAPRRDPALLHDAVREAQLLAELGTAPGEPAGQDETYRLLIGVLLRDPDELAQLRDRTISPLADYDAGHDTELLATLRAFLAHDGSTTETAEAMNLHRHTVGYRLSRVHEVSGLSPYESDGRERLSLGSKAHDILAAQARLDSAALNQ
jgi:hypothetical protein